MPLVSVVMIFKDAAPYLSEAAGSVLAQSWPAVELVLVDDGGSDGSDALARQVVAQAPERVRLLTHPRRENRGTGPSRLLGVDAARGELIAFLDADDRWDPGHLEHDIGLLLAHPEAGMVCGRVRVWHSWSDPEAADQLSPLPFAPGTVVPPPGMFAAVLRHGTLAVHTCSLLVRAEPMRQCAEAAARFASTYEDQALNTLLQLRVSAVISGTETAWYRQHPDSLSAQAMRSGFTAQSGTSVSRVSFLDWLDALPELAPGTADPQLRELLDRALHEQASPRMRAVGRARWLAGRVLPPRARTAAGAALRVARRRGATPAAPPTVTRVAPPQALSGAHAAYAARFLHRWGEDVHGRVVEVGRGGWAVQSGRATPVEQVDRVEDLEPGAYDCVLAPSLPAQAADVDAALASLRRALRPGGTLLVLLPGLRRLDPQAPEPATVWTVGAAQALIARHFPAELTTVDSLGNAATAAAALTGRPLPPPAPLLRREADLPMLVGVRALLPA